MAFKSAKEDERYKDYFLQGVGTVTKAVLRRLDSEDYTKDIAKIELKKPGKFKAGKARISHSTPAYDHFYTDWDSYESDDPSLSEGDIVAIGSELHESDSDGNLEDINNIRITSASTKVINAEMLDDLIESGYIVDSNGNELEIDSVENITRDSVSDYVNDLEFLVGDVPEITEDSTSATEIMELIADSKGGVDAVLVSDFAMDAVLASETAKSTMEGGSVTFVGKPQNISPSDDSTGVSPEPTLEIDPFTNDSIEGMEVEVLDSNDDVVYNYESNNETSYDVPPEELNQETDYKFRVRQKGSNYGYGLWSNKTEFATGTVTVEKPENQSPDDEATHENIEPTLEASSFNVENAPNRHESSDWEVYSDSNLNDLVWDSTGDTSNLESISVGTTLDPDTTYYWRVKHNDEIYGSSDWSTETSFTTSYVEKPENQSPSDGETVEEVEPTLEASSFNVINQSGTHESSDWEIASDSSFNDIVDDSYDDTSNLETWSPSGLDYDTTYYWRVKYNDEIYGSSDWSDYTDFTIEVDYENNIGKSIDGGYNAGTISYNNTDYAIIVAPGADGEEADLEWSSDTSTEYGCTDNDDGEDNTNCMLNNDSSLDSGTATKFVDSVQTDGINGYNDWYIPAINELELMYDNMHNSDLSGTDWDNDGESFSSTGYWSSTEDDSDNAKRLDFNGGNTNNHNKHYTFYVRVVRRVAL